MNTKTRLWSLVAATLTSGLLVSGTVTAAPMKCAVEPGDKNYMEIDSSQASACLASGVGNIHGSNATQDLFLSDSSYSDFEFIEKYGFSEEDGVEREFSDKSYLLSYSTDEGGKKGSWEFDDSLWSSFGTIALGFKFGTGNTADEWFVYELASDVYSGEWEFISGPDGKGGGLSHVNLYGKDPVPVPEPGTLGLLGLGLVGFTLARRRNRAS